jgi:ribosome-associated translation inhibitor RaiA
MQVLLNSEPQIENHLAMATYLRERLADVMGHYGAHLARVDAHLSDANSAVKSDTDDIHCTLKASLPGFAPVVVKERAASAHQAIGNAVGKLNRAVAHAIGKHDTHRGRTAHGDALPAEPPVDA